jgi:hypothetical protein
VNSLSREQIIAIFSLAVAVVGTLAAALAVQKKLVRFLLIVLTSALALAFCVYINTSLYDEKSLKELSREEMIQEAKQQLKEEKTRQDEVFKQARERLDRERTEREAAENAAKETTNEKMLSRNLENKWSLRKLRKREKSRKHLLLGNGMVLTGVPQRESKSLRMVNTTIEILVLFTLTE